MKSKIIYPFMAMVWMGLLVSCNQGSTENQEAAQATETAVSSNTPTTAGQEGVTDDVSQPNIVKVASGSKDHTTLVAAVKAADLVNALSNNGPFTVFAPTNAAFDALPAGTVDGLLKPEKKEDLANILQYHVAVSALQLDYLSDGQKIEMVNGGTVTIHVKDGKYMVNDANIVGTVTASNGIIHVIDKVLLPQ